MTALKAEGEDEVATSSMFMSPEFGFDMCTSSALARLYDYIARGVELPVDDIKKWSACGVFDTADRRVQMPGPIDAALSWTLLGMMWNGKISKI
ncbi:MAG TPA: hypothetical protein VF172_08430 [Nitrososphaera sp.]|jgi:hypothetical protein